MKCNCAAFMFNYVHIGTSISDSISSGFAKAFVVSVCNNVYAMIEESLRG